MLKNPPSTTAIFASALMPSIQVAEGQKRISCFDFTLLFGKKYTVQTQDGLCENYGISTPSKITICMRTSLHEYLNIKKLVRDQYHAS